jgi:hypothetical protein
VDLALSGSRSTAELIGLVPLWTITAVTYACSRVSSSSLRDDGEISGYMEILLEPLVGRYSVLYYHIAMFKKIHVAAVPYQRTSSIGGIALFTQTMKIIALFYEKSRYRLGCAPQESAFALA